MDPVSVITSVAAISKTVYSAATTLYTFVNETRNVDQTVRDLATEVNALSNVLKEIKVVLESPTVIAAEKRAPADDNKQLWLTVYGVLEECKKTVARIDSALDVVGGKRSNTLTQAIRTIKLNLGRDEINTLRVQTRTHCSALMMALQMVNIRAAYMAPVVISDDLGSRIESLQASLDLLTTSLEDQRRETARMSRNMTNFESANTERLRILARHILSKATTVHGSTVAGGSIHGDLIDNEARLRTMNWIPEPVVNGRTVSMSSSMQSRGDRIIFSELDSTVPTDLTEASTMREEPDPTEPDSDDEFEFDFTRRLLVKGEKFFSSDDYKEAVIFLQKAVASSNKLPASLRAKLEITEVPMMIATCKYHLQELDEAKADLLMLIRQESKTDQDGIRLCQVSHLLSQICLIQDQLEDAEGHCRNSLKGRRRLLGKEHKDYFSSLGLLSEICSARGEDVDAGIYQDMIPAQIAKLQKRTKMEENRSKQRSETTPMKFQKLSSTLVGHTEVVRAIAFSQDGKLLATGSNDMTAKLWNIATRTTEATLEGHKNIIYAVAFSPDGKLLATGSFDMTVKLWNIATGATEATLEGHKIFVYAVAFSPDGKLLATGSHDMTVKLWNIATGTMEATLKGHTSSVHAVAFSPDGKLLAAESFDKIVKLWNIATGTMEATLKGHTSSVYAVAFSPDGRLVADGSLDKRVTLWNLVTRIKEATLIGHMSSVYAVAFSPDGKLLATGSYDKTVKLWA